MDDQPVEIGRQGLEAGPEWSERAALDPLAAVIDPADVRGGKNRLIHRVHLRALSKHLGDVRGEGVLDFGCGTGRISAWLVERGAAVQGVDVTSEMVYVARTNVPEASFRVVDGSSLPFEDARFDVVVSVYVLQYYVARDESVFRELARVLRPGGRLVAIEQVTERDIGRGAPPSVYADAFDLAGLDVDGISLIRTGESPIVGIVQRHPALADTPALPAFLAWEASLTRWVRRTSYTDALISATKR
jgi:SAM-dependent methyltransferase